MKRSARRSHHEKASGNTIDFSIIPFAPLRQKIISAITSGAVPDAMYGTPAEVVPLQAWEGRLVDVSDVVETQKSRMLPAALASAYCWVSRG
jgi:multiple sugar transport system substrate-binding protein